MCRKQYRIVDDRMPGKKNTNIVCVDNSSAKEEYNTLSNRVWSLVICIDNAPSIIRLPDQYIYRELRIYANIVIIDSKDKSTKYKLSKGHWREIRKTLGDEFGKPFIVPRGCLIRLPVICKNKQVRIYVEKKAPNHEGKEDDTDSRTEEVSE